MSNDDAISPERLANPEMLKQSAIRDYTRQIREEFVAHLLDTAETHVAVVGPFTVENVGEMLHALEREGFRTDGFNDDGARVKLSLPPALFADLRKDADEWLLTDDADESDQSRGAVHDIYGADVTASALLPEDRALAIHPDAIAPNPTVDPKRPYLIRHPRGVCVAEVLDE